jgi:hypothetical protein
MPMYLIADLDIVKMSNFMCILAQNRKISKKPIRTLKWPSNSNFRNYSCGEKPKLKQIFLSECYL